LGGERENSKPSQSLRDADILPSHLALTAVTRFLASPKEGTPALINGLQNARGEEPSGHGMRKQGSEDRIDKEQAPTNGERSPTPSREAHVTFGDYGLKISDAELVGGKREA
jgi:hypothetical protein